MKETKNVQVEIDEIKSLLMKAEIAKGIYSGKTVTIDDFMEKEEQVYIHQQKYPTYEKDVKPIIVSVDCVANTEENIADGGPPFLGYDFVVDQAKADEMRHFITMQIKQNKQPLIKTYVNFEEGLTPQQIWSLEEITSCIKKGFQ